MRVLLVEDDKNLRNVLSQVLVSHRLAVDSTASGSEARSLVVTHPYDLILLDIMLPDDNGIDICRALRRRSISTPILLMSVKATLNNRVNGLDSGADDFISKPFDVEELMARVRSLLRRKPGMNIDMFCWGPISLDPQKRAVRVRGKPVSLSTREFMLLEFLMQNGGKVLSREDIIDHVWDQSYDSFSNVVDVFVCFLRKKLQRAGVKQDPIETIRGSGYRLNPISR